MRTKLKLNAEELRVEGFATADRDRVARGTVQARVAGQCTEAVSCPCASGRWACGPFTAYSCDYTQIGHGCESFPTEVDPSCMC